jgi:serine-type D-Ala-D-Ala carboxypeptidase (penicillin-binding protein 5/6)
MKLERTILIIFAVLIFSGMSVEAATPPAVTAKGIAVYGWKDNTQTPLLIKNEHRIYPIASITKLITAKAVLDLYKPTDIFTITQAAAATEGSTLGISMGAMFSRDDLLKALLIRSNNDAATAFMGPVGEKKFLKKMNDILHINKYTSTSFINPSGLDPAKKLRLKPNRMTPYLLTKLIHDIYAHDDLLRDITGSDNVTITNLKSNTPVMLKQTNKLFREENYKDKIVMSKTGLTNLSGQNVAFITKDVSGYDYVTVVLLGAKSRTEDSMKILDWLAAN